VNNVIDILFLGRTQVLIRSQRCPKKCRCGYRVGNLRATVNDDALSPARSVSVDVPVYRAQECGQHGVRPNCELLPTLSFEIEELGSHHDHRSETRY
jgi:hypothetical protein